MARAKLTQQEFQSALRQAGGARVEDVQSAILENDGAISGIQRKVTPEGPKSTSGGGAWNVAAAADEGGDHEGHRRV